MAPRARPSQLLQAPQREAPSGRNRFYPRWPVAGSKYGLAPSAHGQAEYETNAEADSDSRKRVTLNCIAGFLDRVGRHVLGAVVLGPLERPTIGHFGW